MSGHSKWATIKRSKGAADAKRAVLFTKLAKNISVAARQGKDPVMNPSLREAIDKARASSMPKDNIERAVLRGAGELPGQTLEEMTYEGHGPGGVAFYILTVTDNSNRTVQELKRLLSSHGGSLGGPGAVAWMFQRKGVLRYAQLNDEQELVAIDAGAEDIQRETEGVTVLTPPDLLETVKTAVACGAGIPLSAGVEYVPNTQQEVSDPKMKEQLENMYEELESSEDVSEFFDNAKLV
ncbi:MAG: YebC/PmpR family DNA-binding transcriptional regulator [Patescibacteria group bacterium]